MFLFGGGLPSLLIAMTPLLIGIALCVHVVRTGQQIYWIFLILFIPVLGALVYVIAILIPDLAGGARAIRDWDLRVYHDCHPAGQLESAAGVFDGVGDCRPGAIPDGPAGVF